MSTNGSNQIKVKFVADSRFGFVKRQIYTAFKAKSKFGKSDMICVIDRFGEEYAYPATWFEIIS